MGYFQPLHPSAHYFCLAIIFLHLTITLGSPTLIIHPIIKHLFPH